MIPALLSESSFASEGDSSFLAGPDGVVETAIGCLFFAIAIDREEFAASAFGSDSARLATEAQPINKTPKAITQAAVDIRGVCFIPADLRHHCLMHKSLLSNGKLPWRYARIPNPSIFGQPAQLAVIKGI